MSRVELTRKEDIRTIYLDRCLYPCLINEKSFDIEVLQPEHVSDPIITYAIHLYVIFQFSAVFFFVFPPPES